MVVGDATRAFDREARSARLLVVRVGLSDCGGGRSTDGVIAGRWILFNVAMKWY